MSSLDTLKSERESLERIHTFSLKESYIDQDQSSLRSHASSKDSSVLSSRSCSQYMPEKVKICHKQLKVASVSLAELLKIQQEFLPISELTLSQR